MFYINSILAVHIYIYVFVISSRWKFKQYLEIAIALSLVHTNRKMQNTLYLYKTLYETLIFTASKCSETFDCE